MATAQATFTPIDDDGTEVDVAAEVRGTNAQVADRCTRLGATLSRAALALRRSPAKCRPAICLPAPKSAEVA